MVERSIVEAVRRYLRAVREKGLSPSFGVLFGSYVRGNADEWSDIDLLVISPRFDEMRDRKDISLLWRLTVNTDKRIEPIPVGLNQWKTDDSSAIIEIARREGEVIDLVETT